MKILLLLTPEEAYHSWWLVKAFELPALPRQGELVRIGGNRLEINGVTHIVGENYVEIEVKTGHLSDVCHAFLENQEGWKIRGSLDEDMAEFLEMLERISGEGGFEFTCET